MTDIEKFKAGLAAQREKLAAIKGEHQGFEESKRLSADMRLEELQNKLAPFVRILHDFARENIYTTDSKTIVELSQSSLDMSIRAVPPNSGDYVDRKIDLQTHPLRFSFTLRDDNTTVYVGELATTEKPIVAFLRAERNDAAVSCVGYVTKVQLRDIEDAAMLLQQWQAILELTQETK